VFEQDGQGGLRQVGFTFGKFEEVDAARYRELFEGRPGSARPAGRPPAAPTNMPKGRPSGAPEPGTSNP
jgi:hypothetical protein